MNYKNPEHLIKTYLKLSKFVAPKEESSQIPLDYCHLSDIFVVHSKMCNAGTSVLMVEIMWVKYTTLSPITSL